MLKFTNESMQYNRILRVLFLNYSRKSIFMLLILMLYQIRCWYDILLHRKSSDKVS